MSDRDNESTRVVDGKVYKQDRHGYWRTEHGHLMKGQNLSAMKRKRREQRDREDKILNATPAEIRRYINRNMTDVVDVLLKAAKQGDVSAATALLSRCVPTLKSVEHTGDGVNLPTLILYQQPGQQAQVIEGVPSRVPELSREGGDPHPDFSDARNTNMSTPDNFCNSGDNYQTEEDSDDGSGIVSTTHDRTPPGSTASVLFAEPKQDDDE